MRFLLSYIDPTHGEQSSVYTEKDFREWLDNLPNYTGPAQFTVKLLK